MLFKRFFNQQQLSWKPRTFNPLVNPASGNMNGNNSPSLSSINSLEEVLDDTSNASHSLYSSNGHYGGINKMSSSFASGNSIAGNGNIATLPFPEEQNQNYSHTFVDSSVPLLPLSEQVVQILLASVDPQEVEIKPDGSIYLPEIKYRKRLLQAFGPTGWSLLPKGPHSQISNFLSREYALYVGGRIVSQARGVSLIQSFSNPGLASEAVKSNALMRCCKDLGIASELWSMSYIEEWKNERAIRRQDKNGKFVWVKKEDVTQSQY